MFETFILAAASLGIVLYFQARTTAREIRSNRGRHPRHPLAELVVQRK